MNNAQAVLDVSVPSLGESVSEARIAKWVKADGATVGPDDVVAELETDKATVELPASGHGVLRIVREQGHTVNVGEVIARIEGGAATGTPAKAATAGASAVPIAAVAKAATRPPAGASIPPTAPPEERSNPPTPAETARSLSPAVQRLVMENNLDPAQIAATGPGNRLTKGDVMQYLAGRSAAAANEAAEITPPARPVSPPPSPPNMEFGSAPVPGAPAADQGEETHVEISMLRQTIARRLVEAQHTAAILTTFNEIDMSAVIALREKYREQFEKTHQVGLGFLSFFARAACAAIKAVPVINAQLQERAIVYKRHVHLGLAVATDKGLIVPVIRYADRLSMAQIETEVKRLAVRAREGKITLEELSGGTFTITNGGVFGSLLSTPILNPPQSAILGLHKIEKRAVVINDQIVIRPMMYLALSYDHRLIDGREAVTFLVHIKELLEDPARLLLEV